MNQASVAGVSANTSTTANPAIDRTPWLVRYCTWPTLFIANIAVISLALVEH